MYRVLVGITPQVEAPPTRVTPGAQGNATFTSLASR